MTYLVITTFESEFFMMDSGTTESLGIFNFVEDAFKTVDSVNAVEIAYKHVHHYIDGTPKEVNVSKRFGKGYYAERHRLELDLKEINGVKNKSYSYLTIRIFEELA